MEELVINMGFESLEEFNKLNSSIDLSSNEKMKMYLDWRDNDGSKEGLLKLV